jgi:plasmid stabilization system protein ParE
MIRARLSPRAERDVEAICRRIASDDPQAAERVRLTMLGMADFLVQHRGIGHRITNASARHADIRWLVVPKYHNYLMFYRPHQDTIMVVRILHAAQDWTRFFPPTH